MDGRNHALQLTASDNNLGPLLHGIDSAIFALPTIVVVLRLFTRAWVTRNFGWDDATMLLTQLLAKPSSLSRSSMAWVNNRSALSADAYTKFLKYYYLDTAQFFIALATCKISICLFLLCFSQFDKLKRILWALIGFLLISHLVLLLLVVLQCSPMHEVWIMDAPGRCFSKQWVMDINLIQAVVSFLTDFICAAFAIYLLRNLNIRRQSYIALCVLMGLGIVTGGIAIARTVTTYQIKSPNLSWVSVPNSMTRMLELNIGNIAACVPIMKPFSRYVRAQIPGRDPHQILQREIFHSEFHPRRYSRDRWIPGRVLSEKVEMDGCSATSPRRFSTMLPAIITLFVLTTPLHGLSMDRSPSMIVPMPTKDTVFPGTVNLSEGAEWPQVPWVAAYFHDQCFLRFNEYGPEYGQDFSGRVKQGFDALIYQIARSPKTTWGPSDLPLVILDGIVNLHIIWVAEFSSVKLALTLAAMRDLMAEYFGPRDIAQADFALAKSDHHQTPPELKYRPIMSSSGVLSLSRTAKCSAVLHQPIRGYCWSRRHRWTFDTSPKSLRYPESICKVCTSDFDRLPYRGIGKDLGSFTYRNLTRGEGRSSSSWAKWTSEWNDLDREQRVKSKSNGEDHAAWDRHLEKLEKDTADIYRLVRRRIEEDPFDALFGRSYLYPSRVTWWTNSDDASTTKVEKEKNDSEPKRYPATDMKSQQPLHKTVPEPETGAVPHGKSPTSSVGPTTKSEYHLEDFTIDPITMRKVPRPTIKQPSEPSVIRTNFEEPFEIPVKQYGGEKSPSHACTSPKKEASISSNIKATRPAGTGTGLTRRPSKHNWLTHEGFASPGHDATLAGLNATRNAGAPAQNLVSDVTPPSGSPGPKSSHVSHGLKYDIEENKTEDIDLLRASDIRASSGLGSRPRRESAAERRSRRETLESRFVENLNTLRPSERMLATIIEDRRAAKSRKAYEVYKATYETEISTHKAAMEAMPRRQHGAPAAGVNSALSQPEQAEGDMASNVHEFAGRERWYKRKAPHAIGLKQQETVQAVKDRALVKEIRGIYEEAYGTIDTKHRQQETGNYHIEPRKPDMATAPAPLLAQGKDVNEHSEGQKKITVPRGPLSSQEKIGTMLRQLLDDSRYMQKLVDKPESSASAREELFHRNRSIRNASDAITEALSSSLPRADERSITQAGILSSRAAASNVPEPPATEPKPLDAKKTATVYNVLAYDPSTQQITTAEMSSPGDSPSERRLSLSEALSSLTEPAKFLPYLTTLQSHGHEIVSSDTNILVLRKIYKTPPPSSTPSPVADGKSVTEKEGSRRNINPIDGTTTQTGNFASPTGFVNHDSVLLADELETTTAEQDTSGQKVRRKEDVFSGASERRREKYRYDSASDRMKRRARYRRDSRGGRTVKRMLWEIDLHLTSSNKIYGNLGNGSSYLSTWACLSKVIATSLKFDRNVAAPPVYGDRTSDHAARLRFLPARQQGFDPERVRWKLGTAYLDHQKTLVPEPLRVISVMARLQAWSSCTVQAMRRLHVGGDAQRPEHEQRPYSPVGTFRIHINFIIMQSGMEE
ncbi:MAG: hypothetical protein Q9173_002897 [Seirophora scorigena]